MTAPSYKELLQENEELRAKVAELAMAKENHTLRTVIAQLEQEITNLKEELTKLREENEQLKEDPPPVVKPPQKGEPKRPGCKPGHPGTARPTPSKVDEERELTLECCPDCGSPLSGAQEERVRYVEDLLPPRLHVTKYRIKRYYCPNCKRLVERKPTDVLGGHQLGLHTMSYVVYLREELRLPVNLVQRALSRAGLKVSSGEIERSRRRWSSIMMSIGAVR
jgi:transposase